MKFIELTKLAQKRQIYKGIVSVRLKDFIVNREGEALLFFENFLIFNEDEIYVKCGFNLTDFDRFCNQYYWFNRYAKEVHRLKGTDEGLFQQRYQMLESLESKPYPVDWNLVEELLKKSESENLG